MSGFWVKSLAVLSVPAALSVLTPACAHNDQSFFINHVQAPPLRQPGAACQFEPTRDSPALFSGSLDVASAKSYQAVVVVVNQLVLKQKTEELRIETARIQVNGATVKVTKPDGTVLDEYTNLTTSTVDPGLGTGIVNVVAISPTIVNAFKGNVDGGNPNAAALRSLRLCDKAATQIVIANIKVFGRTLGGKDIESNEFAFPISVCRGCLVDFTCAIGVRTTCEGIPVAADDKCTALPCFQGQDITSACQACLGDPACDFSVQKFCS